MKNSRYTDSIRVFFGLSLLMTSIIVAGIEDFRTSAASTSQETSSKTVSVRLKSQNSPLINLLPGRDLPSAYESIDYSSEQLKAGQTRPLALASADFDADGFPDLVTGYSSADGGILTLHKGNPEAFAPTTAESFALIGEGHFPDSFLAKAQSFAVPAAPDFLVTGDFDRDGNLDVISATRGGDKIYLFSGAGRNGGGFGAWREISLPGRVTAMTAGEIDAADNRTDLLVGVENEAGASLLVFENSETGVFAAPLSYQISSPAISLELGKLDDDAFADAAILTGAGVSILHGRNQSAGKESVGSVAARLEKINLPFVPQAMTIGDFIFDRAGKMELALLAEDGSIQIAKRGDLDERPFSVEQAQANRRQRAQKQLLGKRDNHLKTWQPEISEDWTIDGSMSVADAAASQRSIAAPILMKANLSGQNTDDILFLDSESREIKILSAQNAEQSGGENSISGARRSVYSLEAVNEPVAMLSMKLNIFARPGLVVLQSGKGEPSIIPAAPAATYTVNRTDDINRSVATVCNGAASDCSLREAISKANSSPGADMINVPAGTYTLSLANAGGTNEDNNATGDLDINDSLTITGLGGQAATVVQAGTTATNGIDKVFASNPFCTSVVNTSFTGLTVRYGRNTQPNGAADFSFTGGGLDWCNTGAGGTLTVTNSTFDSNSATTGPGGGIDLDTASTTSGSVTLTNVTISNNKSQTPTSGGVTVGGDGGGLAILGGVTYNTTITNSTISGNTAGVANNPQRTDNGGGIFFSQVSNSGSSLTVSGTTISNNSAFGGGGGIRFIGATGGTTAFTINQSSVVSGNTSGGSGGTNSLAQGGGLFVEPFAGSATINKTTIVNNVLSASAAINRGGAGIAAGQGNTTVSYCRIVGNTGTTTLGTGLNKDINPGTVNAAENWWGCSTGPSAAPCDTAVLTPGSAGSLITTPYIVLRNTASPSTIKVGQSTTLTASFLTDSAGNALSLSNITVLLGLPITFNNAVRGTISNAQTTIQSSGTATATFTATSAGAGSADAIVDNDVGGAGRTNRATITINQGSTSTTVTSSVNPSKVGQSVSFTATVNPVSPASGTPSGTVQFVVDGSNFGSPVVLVGGTATSSSTTTLSAGNHTVSANYSGDANFTSSSGSLGGGQTIIAPPSISKSFTPASIGLNGVSTLTITITNPSANTISLTGVSVSDSFPTGVEVAATPSTTNSCSTGIFAPAAAATSVSISGATIPANTACTFSVQVKGTTFGDKVNTTGAVTSSNGGTGNTASATLSVVTLEGDVTPRLTGDGVVDATDVQQIERFAVGFDKPYQLNEGQRADCAPRSTFGDGQVDATDVQQAERYSIGLDPKTPANGPTSVTRPEPAAAPLAKGALMDAPAAPRTLSVQSVNTSQGQNVTVNILDDAAGDEAGYTFSLSYDQTVLSNPQIAGGGISGETVLSNATTAGQIGFSVRFGGGTIPQGNGQVLLRLTFTVAANAAFGATPINFTSTPAVQRTSDANAQPLATNYVNGTVTVNQPTAAAVSVSGRVLTESGRGIRNVVITMTDALGNTRAATSTTFGYYRFENVAAGETYIFTAGGKRFTFRQNTIVQLITEDTSDINFIAAERTILPIN